MSKQPWALILGASSGFGEATALELARAGMNIFGVHLDRREKAAHAAEIQERIQAMGREAQFFNINAADDGRRKECVEQMTARVGQEGTLRVLLHSLKSFSHATETRERSRFYWRRPDAVPHPCLALPLGVCDLGEAGVCRVCICVGTSLAA